MALALSAQLPSYTPFPGGSIILTSERELPTDRLIQLAKSMLASQDTQHNHRTAIPTPSVKQLLDNIHTNKCTDVDALDHALSYSLPWVLEKNRLASTGIRLIVLDSITALFRGGETTFSSTSAGLAHRSRLLCSIADKLKALAVEYDIAVVVINQVSDVFNKLPQPPPLSYSQTPGPSQMPPSQAQSAYDFSTQFYTDPGPEPPMLYSTQARWFSGQSQGYRKEASLGIVWANAINTRVMMSRTLRRKRITADSLENVVRKRQRVQEQTGAVDNTDGSGPSQDTHDEYWGIELEADTPTLIRRFHLVFSPFAPAATVDYIIAPSGIHTLTGSRRLMDLASILRKRKALEAIRKEMDDSGVAGLNGNGKGNEENGVDDEFGLEDSLEDIPAELWEGKFADQVAEAEAVGVVGDGS
jgi:DNA repair protein RAD57